MFVENKGWKTTSFCLSQLLLLKLNLLPAVHQNCIFLFICFVGRQNDNDLSSFPFFPRTPADLPGCRCSAVTSWRRLAENYKCTKFLRFLIWTLCFSVQSSQKEIPNKRVFSVFLILCISFWPVFVDAFFLPRWTWMILMSAGLWFWAFLSGLLTLLDE